MTLRIIDRIAKLQEHLLELGVSRGVLSLPAPRMLSISAPTSENAEPANIFAHMIVEEEILEVSRDLFASGHYSLAVQEAYKAVERCVAKKTSKTKLAGTKLMELVFSPNDPELYWSGRVSQSQIDEQHGYHRLFSGAMLGIRNPVTHEFNWVDEAELALELIAFAQHLLRKAKRASWAER